MSSTLSPQKPLQAFLHFLEKEKRGSVHTLRCYRSDLNQFQRFLSDQYDHHELVGISSDWVRAWVVSMMQEGDRAIHRKVSAFRTFNRYAWMSFTDKGQQRRFPAQTRKAVRGGSRTEHQCLWTALFSRYWAGLGDGLMITCFTRRNSPGSSFNSACRRSGGRKTIKAWAGSTTA